MAKFITAVRISPAIAAIIIISLILGCQPQNSKVEAEARAKVIADKVLQFWNEGKVELADEIYTADVVRHDFALNQDFEGLDAQKKLVEGNRITFPDLKLTLIEMDVAGDTLTLMWSISGTNTGPMENMPPTGKAVEFKGLSLLHTKDGKIIEIWDFYNQLYILQQLGFTVVPPAEAEEK